MRKSGWAGAAAGLFSAALLLSACGGGSSATTTGGGSTASGSAASTTSPGTHPSVHPSDGLSSPPAGALYFSIQKAALNGKPGGFMLVDSVGYVVYTYAGDTPGKAGTCTGSCAATWTPVTGTPLKSNADNLPGTFGTTSTGQITYNGLPLYSYKGETPNLSHAGGQWKDIPISCSYIVGGCPS
jgi:predicted lipoprotein with Yx(FWY)xxD motif